MARTVELIEHAQTERGRLGLAPVAFEVGTEEVAGGLADEKSFEQFLNLLKAALEERGLSDAWPSFVVGKVGTDLHTTDFDPGLASRLRHIAALKGSLLKGHYTDWVGVPEVYSASGMGGANVRPEFTVEEADALRVLCGYEDMLVRSRSIAPSGFLGTLTTAVLDSGRWRKWLRPDEPVYFAALAAERQRWLVASGARYVWTDPGATVAELGEHFGVSDRTP